MVSIIHNMQTSGERVRCNVWLPCHQHRTSLWQRKNIETKINLNETGNLHSVYLPIIMQTATQQGELWRVANPPFIPVHIITIHFYKIKLNIIFHNLFSFLNDHFPVDILARLMNAFCFFQCEHLFVQRKFLDLISLIPDSFHTSFRYIYFTLIHQSEEPYFQPHKAKR